jgi:hypothetical protein
VLIAIDVLMNLIGNSGQSFDDIFKANEELPKYIPPQELQFIQQFDLLANEHSIVSTLRALIPQFNREDITDQGRASLMPLLLMLRTVTPATRGLMLKKMPIPIMMMLRNRMGNGPQDDKARGLVGDIKRAMEERAKKGESYQVRAVNRAGLSGVATVGTPPHKAEPAAVAKSAAKMVPSRPAADPRPAPRPAPDRPSAPPAEGSAPPPPPPPAGEPQPAAPPAPAAPAERQDAAPAAPALAADTLLDARLLIAWRMDGAHLEVRTLSVRDIATLAGREPPLFVPWVLIALQTGQVFPGMPQDSKDVADKLVGLVVSRIPADLKPRLGGSQAQVLAGQSKTLSPQKFLLAIVAKAVQPDVARNAGALGAPLAALCEKFKANLTDFLRNPSKDDYRELRMHLSAPEKAAVTILQKVARLQ